MHVDLRVLALAALVGAFGAVASLSQIGFALEEDVGLSWLFRLRGSRPAPDEAVVVRFDRDSLARLRSLPSSQDAWPEPLKGCAARFGGLEVLDEATSLDRVPRALHACLVEELAQQGAAVIAFDLVFRRDPRREQGVAALATALRAHGRVVLLEKAVRVWLPSAPRQTLAGEAMQADLLEGPHLALKAAAIATAPFLLPQGTAQVHQFWAFNPALAIPTQLPMRALEALALPALERLAGSAGESGPSDLIPAEALRRHIDWLHANRGRLGWLLEQGQHANRGGWSEQELRPLRALDQAYGGPDGYYLNFYGPAGTFPTISAADLLAPEDPGPKDLASPDLRGRVVFVGYQELNVPQASDSFPTAFQSRHGVDLSGVEIAATAFANLLHGETLVGLPEWARTILVLVLGCAFTLASCLGTVWRGLVATFALAAAYGAVVFAGFVGWQLWLPVVVPLLGLLPLAIGLGQATHYRGAARWLGVYVPRQVSQHLLKGGEFAAARPQRRELTIMLTDIVGFTTLAERATPEAVTAFVNRHFTMLTHCVEAEGGVVGQFTGDSVMAFWGAPDPRPDHAARACRTALAIAAALKAENGQRQTRGEPTIRMRIGIHTGEVTAGNVGAPGRSSYGIVGDVVNATQRIEQLAKTICHDRPTAAILVSGRTRTQAGEGFTFVEMGAHALRGRQEIMQIHRLVPMRVVSTTTPHQEPSADEPVPAAGGG